MRLEGESAKALLLSSCTSDRPSIDVSPRSPLFIIIALARKHTLLCPTKLQKCVAQGDLQLLL